MRTRSPRTPAGQALADGRGGGGSPRGGKEGVAGAANSKRVPPAWKPSPGPPATRTRLLPKARLLNVGFALHERLHLPSLRARECPYRTV